MRLSGGSGAGPTYLLAWRENYAHAPGLSVMEPLRPARPAKFGSCGISGLGAGPVDGPARAHSTVTDFARLRGLSTSVPRASAAW
jgi:hypothetical protein